MWAPTPLLYASCTSSQVLSRAGRRCVVCLLDQRQSQRAAAGGQRARTSLKYRSFIDLFFSPCFSSKPSFALARLVMMLLSA